MDLSTLVIFVIAVLIIAYRVKTWKGQSADSEEAAAVQSKAESDQVKRETKRASGSEAGKKSPTAFDAGTEAPADYYHKKLNGTVEKNKILAACVEKQSLEGRACEFKSQPKRGVSTFIVVVKEDDARVVGVVLERQKEHIVLIKSFDVKRGKNGDFKVPTSFSPSQSVKSEMLMAMSFSIDHYVGHDDKLYPVEAVFLDLQ